MTLHRRQFLQLLAATAAGPRLVAAQQARTVRLRGTIEALSADKLTLMERSGQRMELALAPNWTVTEVYPVTLQDVKAGSFVGVGGMPQSDGSQKAIAVVLFPENMRGTGEGHYPFDFLPQSTMTNATVADVARSPSGERLELRYKDGQKTIVVPPEAPIVSLRPGERGMVQVGQRVAVNVQDINGTPTVVRVNAGKNGFAPPY
ncbi:hypothetical protein [Ramlibacter alkalitolerans]|jgi:hypothetical protein|uniref:DUF5666 domain-containing protein n=1 Tax=Ramlibacter alkalitolerans TaxID=2039631 RepID=A0ABS1JZ06_9BURK|nr:hypothetical protein [Ramlibacter alkalitolerans]MBL0428535.1 hypothetical protein [Ramlibacter alkalitolerans]